MGQHFWDTQYYIISDFLMSYLSIKSSSIDEGGNSRVSKKYILLRESEVRAHTQKKTYLHEYKAALTSYSLSIYTLNFPTLSVETFLFIDNIGNQIRCLQSSSDTDQAVLTCWIRIWISISIETEPLSVPWYLNQMVAKMTVRTNGVKQVFGFV